MTAAMTAAAAAALVSLLLLWGLFVRPRRCEHCGARIQRDEAPYDRLPICWRCWR